MGYRYWLGGIIFLNDGLKVDCSRTRELIGRIG